MKHWLHLSAVSIALLMAAPLRALTISPSRTEVVLSPGKSMKATLSAHNETAQRIQVELSMKDWWSLPENKDIHPADWLTLKGPTYFWLKAGESREVPIRIQCPKKALGQVMAMVSFAYQAEDPTMVTPIISVAVYVTAAGTAKKSATITELAVRLDKDVFQVAVGVKADGNVHLRPLGQATITDSVGHTVDTLSFPEGLPAFPGREQAYFAQDANYKPAPGKYVAHVHLTDGDFALTAAKDFVVHSDGKMEVSKDWRVAPTKGAS